MAIDPTSQEPQISHEDPEEETPTGALEDDLGGQDEGGADDPSAPIDELRGKLRESRAALKAERLWARCGVPEILRLRSEARRKHNPAWGPWAGGDTTLARFAFEMIDQHAGIFSPDEDYAVKEYRRLISRAVDKKVRELHKQYGEVNWKPTAEDTDPIDEAIHAAYRIVEVEVLKASRGRA
jgi:hypothetical protein